MKSLLDQLSPRYVPPQSAMCNRQGAAAILVIALIFSFVIVAAVTVDYAYMQMVRTELRVATDAAAKAGAEALARTEDSEQAIAQAIQYAGLNQVAGHPVDRPRHGLPCCKPCCGSVRWWQLWRSKDHDHQKD